MKTLKVTLKQHTPLIHFQHDQHGATLRASEVKPKLDKYIIRHAFNNEFDECKSYLIGYDDKKPDTLREKFGQGYRALNYKMKIIPYGKKDVSLKVYGPDKDDMYETAFFPMLLSNMGGNQDRSQLNNLVLYDYLVMTIAVKTDRLHKEIDEHIANFFANVNLGQRASKGFGSFTVCEIDNKHISWEESKYYDEGCPLMFFDLESGISAKLKHLVIFSVMDFYWKCLKPGINYTRDKKYPKRYIKSFLYHYMNDYLTPARTWERREIKQYFNLPKQSKEVPPNPNPYVFARAMLGCPDKYLYGSREVKVCHIERDDKKKIDRIPAPIYFKPVCFSDQVCIYVLFDSSVVDKLGEVESRKFSMTYNHRSLDMDIDLFLNKDNYMRFIESYHEYLSFDTDVNGAVYEGEDRLDYIDAEGFGVVPRGFDWKNLLEEGGYVDFGNVNIKVK